MEATFIIVSEDSGIDAKKRKTLEGTVYYRKKVSQFMVGGGRVQSAVYT